MIKQGGRAKRLRRAEVAPCFKTGIPLNGSNFSPLGTAGSAASVGIIKVPKFREIGSSLQDGGLIDEGISNSRDGSRSSQGGGTNSRKRTRGQTGDPSLAGGSSPEGSANVIDTGPSASKTVGGNGTWMLAHNSGDKAEKFLSRRQSGQKSKFDDSKGSQMIPAARSDASSFKAETSGTATLSSSSLLDIYGLMTRTSASSQYVLPVSVNDLLTGSYYMAPIFLSKESSVKQAEYEDEFEQLLSNVLHLLPKLPAVGHCVMSRPIDALFVTHLKGAKNAKAALNLESPVHREDDKEAQCMEKLDNEKRKNSELDVEVGAGKLAEDCVGGPVIAGDGLPTTQSVPKFAVDNLQLYSVRDCLRRLNLISSVSVESLIANTATNRGRAGPTEAHTVAGEMDLTWYKGISGIPLSSSDRLVGSLKTDIGLESSPQMTMRRQQNWVRAAIVENSFTTVGIEFIGKVEPRTGEGFRENIQFRQVQPNDSSHAADAMEVDIKPNGSAQASDAMQVDIVGSVPPTNISVSVSNNVYAPLVITERCQIENAIGCSSWGHHKFVEIDAGRVGNGTETPELSCTVKFVDEGNQERSMKDTVRPLQTAEISPDGRDCGSSIHVNKRDESLLVECRHEQGNQNAKEFVECGKGVGKQYSVALKNEEVDLDVKVYGLSGSPSIANDFSLGLPAMPGSPGAIAAAHILCAMSNSLLTSTKRVWQDREGSDHLFQLYYTGSPSQKFCKSFKGSETGKVPGNIVRESKGMAYRAPVPCSKAVPSERRKSLSQVNETSDRVENVQGNVSRGASSLGAVCVGARSSSLSVKSGKTTTNREHRKDGTSSRDMNGRVSCLPPLCAGGSLLRNRSVKSIEYVPGSTAKGGRPANFLKCSAPGTSQKSSAGGLSQSYRPPLPDYLASHEPTSVPQKQSRQVVSDNKQQKVKPEGPNGGGRT